MSKKLFTENRFFGSLALEKTQQSSQGYVGVDAIKLEAMVGREGEAHTVLRPSGKVMIDDEIFDAKSEVSYIEKGDKIIVKREESGQLYVVKA